jgi:hypothetical protein
MTQMVGTLPENSKKEYAESSTQLFRIEEKKI